MKTAYLLLAIACMFLLVAMLESHWRDPLVRPENAKRMEIPCATWICQGSYAKCQEPRHRKCVNMDMRGMT